MRTKLVILALATLLTVPAYAAGWASKGHNEPSTQSDRDGGFMWPGTDTTPVTGRGTRVYFNGFTTHSAGFHAEVATGLNPNFATVGTERQDWPGRVFAMIGVWKDCNNDGFIGHSDNALFVYKAELLLSTSICKVTPVGRPAANDHNWVQPHNDGKWIHEFIPIGPDAGKFSSTPAFPDNYHGNINDPGARVWADWNKIGDLPPNTRCYIFAPEDTYHTTGGMLEYLDCPSGFLATDTWNTAVGAVGGDNLGAGRLSFSDKPRDQRNSTSQLNRPNPWGDEAGASMVSAFDCSRAPLVGPIAVPSTTYVLRVSQPKTPTTNTNGNAAATVNETENAFQDCNRSNGGTFHLAETPYAGESSGIQNTQGLGKIQTDFVIKYSEGFDAALPIRNNFGDSAPADGGLKVYDVGGMWIATTVLGEDRNPFVDREGLDPQPVTYMTYYASLTATSGLSLNPSGASGVYGAANCAVIGPGAPANRGWQCDPNKWWPSGCSEGYSCGATIDGDANVDVSVRVGQGYQFRDVDCYDHGVKATRDLGLGYGLLTGTACL